MIRAGFLDPETRSDLIDLGRDGSVAHRLARRANALVLLDDGMSCDEVAKVLLLDDDTVRTWHRLYEDEGIEGLVSFDYTPLRSEPENPWPSYPLPDHNRCPIFWAPPRARTLGSPL